MSGTPDKRTADVCRCGAPCSCECDCDIAWAAHRRSRGENPDNVDTWRDVAAAFAAACRLDEFGDVFDAHHGDLTAAYLRWDALERRGAREDTTECGESPDHDGASNQT